MYAKTGPLVRIHLVKKSAILCDYFINRIWPRTYPFFGLLPFPIAHPLFAYPGLFGLRSFQSRQRRFEFLAPHATFVYGVEIVIVAFATSVNERATNSERRIVIESLLAVGAWTGLLW